MIAQLLASAVLAAGPVPLLDAPQAQSLAVAGDQVIVRRGGPPGRLRGAAALRMTWRVPDSRPSPLKTLFVVDRAP
jgi:hypothetical protein